MKIKYEWGTLNIWAIATFPEKGMTSCELEIDPRMHISEHHIKFANEKAMSDYLDWLLEGKAYVFRYIEDGDE